ncbi:MAG: hypothetical protein AAF847_19780 [Bacteroidota bacterium]
MEAHFELSDAAFEQAFQDSTLDPTLFSHEAHLRLAWIHLNRYGYEQAMQNVCDQLQSYTQAVGAADKYNMPLTMAATKAVHHLMSQSDTDNFSDFIEAFPQLKHDFRRTVSPYFAMR